MNALCTVPDFDTTISSKTFSVYDKPEDFRCARGRVLGPELTGFEHDDSIYRLAVGTPYALSVVYPSLVGSLLRGRKALHRFTDAELGRIWLGHDCDCDNRPSCESDISAELMASAPRLAATAALEAILDEFPTAAIFRRR